MHSLKPLSDGSHYFCLICYVCVKYRYIAYILRYPLRIYLFDSVGITRTINEISYKFLTIMFSLYIHINELNFRFD